MIAVELIDIVSSGRLAATVRAAIDQAVDDAARRGGAGLSPDELRALADRIESLECTGVAASWCPIHGDCTCPRDEDGEPHDGLDDPGCPLHRLESSHAAAVPA